MDVEINKIEILKVMVQNVLMPKLQDLRRCFREELKSYCPPNFKFRNKTISTEELLSKDSRLICITAAAGYGKTSFTKYVQVELLSKIENAGCDDLGSREIPIRFACRNITGRNVSEFLVGEIPFSRPYASSTSSLINFLEHFNILWIVDGYDERNSEFTGFFDSLLTILPSNHKIIVTSSPNSLEQIKMQLKRKVCEVSIKCFDVQQINNITKKYLGLDKAPDFAFSIATLNGANLEFLKIPIFLNLYLELWSNNTTNFEGKPTSIYQLHDMILEKYVDRIFQYHIGKIYVTREEDLKCLVTMWFSYLCQVVGESAFSYELRISDEQKEKLMKKAKFYGLNGTYCLSTFFNADKSSVGSNYFIRHKTQKEVLVCLYMKKCDDDALKAVAQQRGNDHLFEYKHYSQRNSFRHLKFLMDCCNECEFARIFVPLLEIYSGFQRPDCLLQIKEENETYFDALKTQFKASCQSLVLHVNVDREVDDLLKVHQYLMPDLNSFKIKIHLSITMHKEINDFISKYKDRNSFNLKFIESSVVPVLVPVIQMFTNEGNQNFIKELDSNDYYGINKCTEEMKKELFKLESLNFVSLDVDDYYYSSSMLHHFATEESEKIDSIVTPPSPLSRDVHPPQTASTTTNPVPLQTPSSMSLAAFDQSTNLHFRIWDIKDSSKVFQDILKVNSKFPSMSVELDFNSDSHDLPDNLLARFLSSSIQVKRLCIKLNASSKFFNVMKLVNDDHIETLVLSNINKLSSVSAFESFFAFWNFDKLNKMKQIIFYIHAKSPLEVIYNKLPSDLLNKTKLIVQLYGWIDDEFEIVGDSKQFKRIEIREMEIVVDSKQFKRIEIKHSKYLSASEIDQLKSISKSFYINY